MRLKVYFENAQEKQRIRYSLKMLIRRAIEQTLDYERFDDDCEVSVTFTDNCQIRQMNKKFRNIDRATDVLSFPLFDDDGMDAHVAELDCMLGDIVLSLEQADIQANEYGHSFEREVAFLTAHSMLHLLGYDHMDEGTMKQQMRAREEAILAVLGLIRQ